MDATNLFAYSSTCDWRLFYFVAGLFLFRWTSQVALELYRSSPLPIFSLSLDSFLLHLSYIPRAMNRNFFKSFLLLYAGFRKNTAQGGLRAAQLADILRYFIEELEIVSTATSSDVHIPGSYSLWHMLRTQNLPTDQEWPRFRPVTGSSNSVRGSPLPMPLDHNNDVSETLGEPPNICYRAKSLQAMISVSLSASCKQ